MTMSLIRRPPGAVALLSAIAFLGPSAFPQKARLPERFQRWLDEEVVWVATPLERDVFLKLQTDRERDLFIEAFWKHRDPTPGTPENEFKTEHFRRLAYANRYYGRTAPMPGWKTDRGRIYIILGAPNDVQRFEGKQGIYNTEIWFYQDKAEARLPAGFNLVFWQEANQGDYKLYSPAKDGPQALLAAYMGDPVDYTAAYEQLQEIDTELARVSLSLIPGESGGMSGRPSMASDLLIQRVENSARDLVEEKYAAKFLQYKDVVEVEYTANYIDCESTVKVVRDPAGPYFVHYALEPAKLSVGEFGGKYSTTFRINGTASVPNGPTVYQFEKTANVAMDEAQMRARNSQPFDIHDLFPLLPGTYRVSILVKNEVSKEFTSVEQTVSIPADGPGVQMTAPLVGYRSQRADPSKRLLKPFQFGSTQVYFQPNRVLTRSETLVVAFQVFGLTDAQRAAAEIRYALTREGAPPTTWSRPLAAYPEFPNIVEERPLKDFSPAHYLLNAALRVDGREVVAGKDEFDLTHVEVVPRPWIYVKLMPESGDPIYDRILGTQLLDLGRFAEAKVLLERAQGRAPEALDGLAALAKAYAALGEEAKIPPLVEPHLGPEKKPSYDLFLAAGQAYLKTGNFQKAIDLLDRATSSFGVNPALLNLIGEAYLGLGKPAEAVAVWEKSLRANADQPEVRKKVAALKEKK
jgi:GWxTD domain-containing protein